MLSDTSDGEFYKGEELVLLLLLTHLPLLVRVTTVVVVFISAQLVLITKIRSSTSIITYVLF